MKLKVGTLFVSLGIGLLICEVGARLLLEPPQYVTVTNRGGATERSEWEASQAAHQELHATPWRGQLMVYTDTGLRLQASTHAVIRNHHLSKRDISIDTNSLGYRNPEIGPKTRTRALFLGDSITFGHYLDEEDTFVRRVQRISEHGPDPYETINAGVGAIGLESELAILVETGLSTQPDVVVIGFYLNDAHPSRGVRAPQLPPLLARSHIVRHISAGLLSRTDVDDSGHAMDGGDRRTRMAERRKSFELKLEPWRAEVLRNYPPSPGDPLTDRGAFHQEIQNAFLDWGSAWSSGAWESMAVVLREFDRLAQLHHFQLMVIAFPVRPQVEATFVYDQPQRRLRKIAEELHAPFLDILPVLRAAHRDGVGSLFYDHCHHTPLGNRLIAESVHTFLRSNLDPR